MRTDGSVAVVALQECHPVDPLLNASPRGGVFKPGSYAFRYIRRQILTFRNDIWRANVIYAAYDAGRMALMALRRKPTIVDSESHAVPTPTETRYYAAQ